MHRRVLVTALAAVAAVPSLALAQQRPRQENTGVGGSDKMGEAEMRHAQQTLATGMIALETSRIAIQKAQNPWVKKFAQYEVAEQENIAEVLKSTGAAPARATEKQSDMVKEMQNMQAGAGFDRAYLEGQLDGHQELLKIQENYIGSGRDRDHVNMAKLARGQIKEHIDLVQTIQRELRS